MKSDHWFYRLFRDLPQTFFRLADLPVPAVDAYTFEAPEYKEISLRLDGIYQPTGEVGDYLFVEAQLYSDAGFYRSWIAKIFFHLHKNGVSRDWRGLALFGSRGLEPDIGQGLGDWIETGRLHRVYLDELPDYPAIPLELAVLKLTVTPKKEVVDRAREFLDAARKSTTDPKLQEKLQWMVEAFVVSNFSQFSRKEIQAMLQIHDHRESAYFKEVKAEGKTEQLHEIIQRLVSKGRTILEITEILDMTEGEVREVLAKPSDRECN